MNHKTTLKICFGTKSSILHRSCFMGHNIIFVFLTVMLKTSIRCDEKRGHHKTILKICFRTKSSLLNRSWFMGHNIIFVFLTVMLKTSMWCDQKRGLTHLMMTLPKIWQQLSIKRTPELHNVRQIAKNFQHHNGSKCQLL